MNSPEHQLGHQPSPEYLEQQERARRLIVRKHAVYGNYKVTMPSTSLFRRLLGKQDLIFEGYAIDSLDAIRIALETLTSSKEEKQLQGLFDPTTLEVLPAEHNGIFSTLLGRTFKASAIKRLEDGSQKWEEFFRKRARSSDEAREKARQRLKRLMEMEGEKQKNHGEKD